MSSKKKQMTYGPSITVRALPEICSKNSMMKFNLSVSIRKGVWNKLRGINVK